MRTGLICGLAAALVLALAPAAQAQRGLTTGFIDSVYGEDDATAREWLDRTQSVGAKLVRVSVPWRSVAPPTRPDGFVASDPGSAGYRWEQLDVLVTRLRDRGIDVLLTVDRAPDWAEGPRRRSSAPPGTWRPDPEQLAAFATALATRYSGSYAALPRVRHFMLWNEPNLATYLNPQWTRRGRGYRAASPAHYRRMLLAFRPAVKRVRADNVVVAGGTSPYGDPDEGDARMQPARFVREMLCLGRRGCERLRFDVLSHHPYSVGRPRRRAFNRDDVSIPDLHKLTRLLRAARRQGTLSGSPRLWVTEVSYDSRPPDPNGVPAATHARWTAETLYLLWKQGARAVVWLLVRDSAPHPSFSASYQSGMFRRGGRAKPSARAFRFPLVIDGARAWGKAPQAGRLLIERRTTSGWRRVAGLQVRAGQVFTRRVRSVRGGSYRARVGTDTSYVWRVSGS